MLEEDILKLYRGFSKVRGPYTWKDSGRKYYQLVSGNRTTTQLVSRITVEVSIGRRLMKDEVVHHRDEDVTNDCLDNLEILSRESHARGHSIKLAELSSKCVWCSAPMVLSKNQMRPIEQRRKSGPFCSRKCSGEYGASLQGGGSEIPRSQPDNIYYK